MKRRSKLTQLMSLILAGTTGLSAMHAGDAVTVITTTSRKTTSNGEQAEKTHVAGRLILSSETKLELGAWLGVHVAPVSPLVTAQLGLAAGMGLAVEHVVPKSPADKAGIRKHDVLKRFDDQSLVNSEQFQVLVRSKKVDDSVRLTFFREGREKQVIATLGEMKPQAVSFDIKKLQLGKIKILDRISADAAGAIGDILILRDVEDAKQGFHTRIVNLMNQNITISDGTGTYVLKNEDGKKHFFATRKNGEVLFDGFIETDLDKSKLRPEVRLKFESLEKSSSAEIDRFMHKPKSGSHGKGNVEIRIISKEEN